MNASPSAHGLTNGVCAECDQPFTQAEYDDRHWRTKDGENVHERCCKGCPSDDLFDDEGLCSGVMADNECVPVDMDELQRVVGEWTAQQWPTETVHGRGMILTEEICELDDALRRLHYGNGRIVRALLKREHGERGTHAQWTRVVQDECADVLCVLLDIANREEFSLAQITGERVREVQSRDRNHDPIEEP